MAFLRSLADNGQAILCTIHQPSAELFQVFDKLLLLRKGGQTVYFGDLGQNATTLIDYFEKNGARTCEPTMNPAEWMLDVIGAGATAASEQDWHTIWKQSPESTELQREVTSLHNEGLRRPPVVTERHSEFATSWGTQTSELIKRGAVGFWRDPTYLMAKLMLNIFGGYVLPDAIVAELSTNTLYIYSLLIGFTFFKSKDTVQGSQNKLFVRNIFTHDRECH